MTNAIGITKYIIIPKNAAAINSVGDMKQKASHVSGIVKRIYSAVKTGKNHNLWIRFNINIPHFFQLIFNIIICAAFRMDNTPNAKK